MWLSWREAIVCIGWGWGWGWGAVEQLVSEEVINLDLEEAAERVSMRAKPRKVRWKWLGILPRPIAVIG